MEFTADELWSRVLEATRDRLQGQTYRTWLAGTTAVGVTDAEILVEVPSQFHVEWIGDRYGPLLMDVIQQILGRPLTVTFRCADPATAAPIPTVEVTPQALETRSPAMAADRTGPPPSLNERYAFERFVVGNNNQLATAACHAVADHPALTYNPLFLYGGVGLGKTHLMHAIGNAVLQADPTRRVAYVPSEQFTNDLVTAIQRGTTAEFRRWYRQMDLLLVDDIQFLKGKERTQEEFFHTFNALYDARKQIVLTSDRPPKEIPGLEERLISRFEWGLVADIKSPDYETRVAILRKKADDDGLMVSHDVMDFIAQSGARRGALYVLGAGTRRRDHQVVSVFVHHESGNLRRSCAQSASRKLRERAGNRRFRVRCRAHPEGGRDTLAGPRRGAQLKAEDQRLDGPSPGRHVPDQRFIGLLSGTYRSAVWRP